MLPERLAMSELDVDAESLQRTNVECGPIESVELFEDGQERRLVIELRTGRVGYRNIIKPQMDAD